MGGRLSYSPKELEYRMAAASKQGLGFDLIRHVGEPSAAK